MLSQQYEIKWDYTNYSEQLKADLAIVYRQAAANHDLKVNRAVLNHNRNIRGCDFKQGERVWLFNPTAKKFKSNWRSPYVIVDKLRETKAILLPMRFVRRMGSKTPKERGFKEAPESDT